MVNNTKKRLATVSIILGLVVGFLTQSAWVGLTISIIGSLAFDPPMLVALSKVWAGPNNLRNGLVGVGLLNLIGLFLLIGLKFGQPWWYGALWGAIYPLVNPMFAILQNGPGMYNWKEYLALVVGELGIGYFLFSTASRGLLK